jgi:hypothetical protein
MGQDARHAHTDKRLPDHWQLSLLLQRTVATHDFPTLSAVVLSAEAREIARAHVASVSLRVEHPVILVTQLVDREHIVVRGGGGFQIATRHVLSFLGEKKKMFLCALLLVVSPRCCLRICLRRCMKRIQMGEGRKEVVAFYRDDQ